LEFLLNVTFSCLSIESIELCSRYVVGVSAVELGFGVVTAAVAIASASEMRYRSADRSELIRNDFWSLDTGFDIVHEFRLAESIAANRFTIDFARIGDVVPSRPCPSSRPLSPFVLMVSPMMGLEGGGDLEGVRAVLRVVWESRRALSMSVTHSSRVETEVVKKYSIAEATGFN